jgi:hypothetical protein
VKLKRGAMAAAEFADLEWINSPPLRIADLRGRAVMVHFWDHACVNCIRVLAYMKVWFGRYADRGLVMVGVHAPEFRFGYDATNVRRAVEELGIPYAVAMDNRFSTWSAYSNRFWPATYLVDHQGFLADYQLGEGGYRDVELSVQELLREFQPRIVLPKLIEPLRPEDGGLAPVRPVSPEVYLGFRRGRIGNAEGFSAGGIVRYRAPDDRMRDVFYADGDFHNEPDCIVHAGGGTGRILLGYDSAEVYLVAAPGESGPAEVRVSQDGTPLAMALAGESVGLGARGPTVRLDAPRLYQLVRNPRAGRHELEIATTSPGARFYCISFVGSAA